MGITSIVDDWVVAYEEVKEMLHRAGMDVKLVNNPRKLRYQIQLNRLFFTDDEYRRAANLITIISS